METANKRWLFEVKEVRAIRAQKIGDPYSASLLIKVVNGEVHIENLISTGVSTRRDLIEIERYIKETLGANCYIYTRYKNGKRIKRKRNL